MCDTVCLSALQNQKPDFQKFYRQINELGTTEKKYPIDPCQLEFR